MECQSVHDEAEESTGYGVTDILHVISCTFFADILFAVIRRNVGAC